MLYKRVLLKLSGECLAGNKVGGGIDENTLANTAKVLKEAHDLGVQLAIVVGGGNFWRGRSSKNMDRVTADQIGMLATCMNALALSDALEQAGLDVRVMSSIEMRQIAELYIRKRALRHLEKGRVIVFACGLGNPYLSTYKTAALRAAEIKAELFLKATNIDGVYDKDPKTDKNAQRFSIITHDEVLRRNLKVMDATAAALCRDNKTDIFVFDVRDPRNILRALETTDCGTLVHS